MGSHPPPAMFWLGFGDHEEITPYLETLSTPEFCVNFPRIKADVGRKEKPLHLSYVAHLKPSSFLTQASSIA